MFSIISVEAAATREKKMDIEFIYAPLFIHQHIQAINITIFMFVCGSSKAKTRFISFKCDCESRQPITFE